VIVAREALEKIKELAYDTEHKNAPGALVRIIAMAEEALHATEVQ
jgi:hypothetical protein